MAQLQFTQALRTENGFIIKIILLDGSLRKGMNIHVTGGITEIKKNNNQFEIVIGCSDQDEIELWEMLNLDGD